MEPDCNLNFLKEHSELFCLTKSFDPEKNIDFSGIESPLPAFNEAAFNFYINNLSLEINDVTKTVRKRKAEEKV